MKGSLVERPTCKTCPYFVCASCDESPTLFEPCCEENGNPVHDVSLCKKHPPIFMHIEDDSAVWGQPEVHKHDWCGEHPDFPAYVARLKLAESSGNSVLDKLMKTVEKY